MFRVAWVVVLALAAAGCGEKSTKPPVELPPSDCGHLVAVTTDYNTGSISVVSGDSAVSVQADLQSIHSDAVARVFDGLIYVVNRFGADNVQILDPAQGFRTIRQIPVGPGSNPHDIAVIAPDRAFVSRNGSVFLLEIDPSTGARRDSISLAPLADADGIPDMDRLFYQAPYLYVGVERIDFDSPTYDPVPPSWLAVVDTRTDALVDVDPTAPGVQGIELQGLNPIAPMVLWEENGSILLVPEMGVFGVQDAGVEAVSLTQWRSAGWLVRETDLGGDLIDFALAGPEHGFATISGPAAVTSLVSFDPRTGAKTGTLYESEGFDLADLAVTRCGYLFVCDRYYQDPGVRVYDVATGRPVRGGPVRVSTGLHPFELVPLD